MREPHLEEAQFDEYQLIVLREITEAWHAFCELHNALYAGRDARRELLPQPDLLELQTLRHSGDNLWNDNQMRWDCYSSTGWLLTPFWGTVTGRRISSRVSSSV